jgi:hypothetical protein
MMPPPKKKWNPRQSELPVCIVTRELMNFLSDIHWAQSEMIAILSDALRKDFHTLDDLPENGTGLAQGLKVINWALERIINQVISGEPCLDEMFLDNPKSEVAIEELRYRTAQKLAAIINPAEAAGGAA